MLRYVIPIVHCHQAFIGTSCHSSNPCVFGQGFGGRVNSTYAAGEGWVPLLISLSKGVSGAKFLRMYTFQTCQKKIVPTIYVPPW